jgi:alpha-ketoglutarate-dependent taurine dioxygenase
MDGETGVAVWSRDEHQNALLDNLVLLHADNAFGGHFKRELTDYYDMEVAISRSPVGV